jgi:hypothetical protein
MADTTLELMTRLADRLSPADKQSLIKYLEGQLQREKESAPAAEQDASGARPKSLRGIWRDSFPPDVDVDAILHEIRHKWEEEWTELSERSGGHATDRSAADNEGNARGDGPPGNARTTMCLHEGPASEDPPGQGRATIQASRKLCSSIFGELLNAGGEPHPHPTGP